MNTVEECEEYILNIPKFKKKTLLSDTADFYNLLGSPARNIPIIHVAGTNGKGSTCFYISQILKEHGLRVGLFISPHLISMKERFVFDNKEADDDLFVRAFNRVFEVIESLDKDQYEKMHPSFFEILFHMFMIMADEKKPDVIVLETGLGGMLDATNIFEKPSLTVICSVSIDHVEQLGNTLEEIATQKAGIIKKGVPLVCQDNGEIVNDVLDRRAADLSSKVYRLDERSIHLNDHTEKFIDFSVNFEYDSFACVHNLSVRLTTGALYQRLNASLAVLAAKIYLKDAFDSDKTKKGLENGNFPGRLERVADNVFVDGAHNEGAMKRLLETLSKNTEQKILIFGACVDKDYPKMLNDIVLSDIFERIILTEINSQRSAKASSLAGFIPSKSGDKVTVTSNLKEAVDLCDSFEGNVYIAGSLYLVGEAKELFGGQKND